MIGGSVTGGGSWPAEVRMPNSQVFRHRAVLTLICAALSAPAFAQFETRSITPATGARDIVVADFNRDGNLDFAIPGDSLQVQLGNGDGTFQPPINYLPRTGAITVATADLNHDGILDLAVTDLNGLFVLIGKGDGTFHTPTAYATPCDIPYDVHVGDFNGDKKPDLIVTCSSAAALFVSVFLGNGDGTFQEPPIISPTDYSGVIGIGDFNGDGKLDVVEAATSADQVQILLGNGDGTFSPAGIFPVNFPESVTVADLRGNGKLDVVTTDGSYAASVLLGNGDGTFQPAVEYPVPSAIWVDVADLNGDGKLDLAVAQFFFFFGPGASVLLGNGDGSFQPAVHYPAGKAPFALAAGDFNGDGKPDLLLPDYELDNVILLLNTGAVSFSPTTQLHFPPQLLNTISSPQTVTLTNTGTTALSISSMSVQGQFQASNNCGSSVAAGVSCAISVMFKPKATGGMLGSITLIDSASSKPQIIELTGAGTVVTLSPNALNFPAQKVGTTSPPQTATLTNHGSTALNIKLIFTTGLDGDSFSETNNCPPSLNAGASCKIAVTFSPKLTGPHSARLGAEDDGGGGTQEIVLTGIAD
jgi:hypothetical protein